MFSIYHVICSNKVSHLLFKRPMSFSRIPFFLKFQRKPVLLSKSEYKILYDFTFIRLPVGIVRSGYTFSFINLVSSPVVYYFVESATGCLMILGVVGIHFLLTVGFSKFAENTVGKIYVNKNSEIESVLFSSIDRYGKRIDRIHNANELINCEYYSKILGRCGFIQIAIENSEVRYKVNLRHCKIHDPYLWDNLFGKSIIFDKRTKKYDESAEPKRLN